ncbi:MAG: hypothetical protein Kow0047_02160 [Anaerolineae bacterium]
MDLKTYMKPLLKWWWLLLLASLIATVSSYLATRQQPPIYSSRVTLMVGRVIEDPNPSNNELWLSQQLAGTYADIVRREPIRRATMEALGLDWLPQYSARVVPNTQLLEITVVDTNPQRAQAVANELARQLIRQSPTGMDQDEQRRQAFINQQLDELEKSIIQTREEITKKQEELARLFSARQLADTQAQIASLQSKLSTLQSNYANLLANTQRGAINTLTVIEPAALPTYPIGPNKLATIGLAALIGLAVAAGAAFLMEYLDDTLRSPEQVEAELALTTLGGVPIIHEIRDSDGIFAIAEQSAAMEAYRLLRTNLQFAAVDQPVHMIQVTSSGASEGKSLSVANLGLTLAMAGHEVILVDADLRRPTLHRLFGLQNNVGLTTALLEDRPDLQLVLRPTAVERLSVLTSGPLPPNPAELLGTARMQALLADLQRHADFVLIDSPPTLGLADALILATQVDGVIFVVDASHTRRDQAKRAVSALRQVKARVIGVVLNRLPPGTDSYAYYYYYGYRSSEEAGNGSGIRSAARRSSRTRARA